MAVMRTLDGWLIAAHRRMAHAVQWAIGITAFKLVAICATLCMAGMLLIVAGYWIWRPGTTGWEAAGSLFSAAVLAIIRGAYNEADDRFHEDPKSIPRQAILLRNIDGPFNVAWRLWACMQMTWVTVGMLLGWGDSGYHPGIKVALYVMGVSMVAMIYFSTVLPLPLPPAPGALQAWWRRGIAAIKARPVAVGARG